MWLNIYNTMMKGEALHKYCNIVFTVDRRCNGLGKISFWSVRWGCKRVFFADGEHEISEESNLDVSLLIHYYYYFLILLTCGEL